MDFAMEDGYCELENSGCSSTSTIDNWNDWSPVIDDWAPLAADTADIDFHSLIESMMMPASAYDFPESIITSNESSPARISDHDDSSAGEGEGLGHDKGLRLVHMLMAAAEALTGPHKSRELARVILVRLREMVSPQAAVASPALIARNMERLATHFTDALQGLLDGPRAGGSHHRPPDDRHQPGDVTAAFQLLQDMSPYVKFGHFTANQAIIESVSGDRRVHIVDFDIMEGVQWASLMQALISQKKGSPPPHVRITAITRGGGGGSGRKPMSSVQETGRRLVSFAASLGLPFSFSQCRLDPDEQFRPSAVKIVKGETLIANCVLHPPHLPHRSASSTASFLTGIAALNAKLVTLVQEEGEIRKGDEENGFTGRFMDELQRYSAIWDSLEAGFPMQGRARRLVEKVILGPTIASAVQRAYQRREEKEGDRGWGDWMSNTMGFGRVGISFFNHCQARLLLGLFHDGYRVEEDAANKLVLGWKSRRLISASVWSAPPPSPPPSTTTTGFSG